MQPPLFRRKDSFPEERKGHFVLFFFFFFSSRSTFIAYGPIENQFVEFMWPTRVSEMMQYSAKLRPAGINIYVSDIAAVGWRSSCGEIKHGKWRKRKEKGSDDKATRAGKKIPT